MQHRTFAFDTHHFEGALTEALVESGELAPQLLTQHQELAPRFADYYSHLCRLPRRARRALQRQWKRSLSAIALLLALGQAPALAATIPVTPGTPPAINPDSRCSLVEAMENANGGAIHADCVAGAAGADTITLPAASTQLLTQPHNGVNGLPLVASEITIEGKGSTIERESATDFRILALNASGNLILKSCTVTGGNTYYSGDGAGIANFGGRLALSNSTIVGNDAGFGNGGGVYNYGTLTLTDSAIVGNSSRYSGGGVYSLGTLTLTNSTVSDNSGRRTAGVDSSGKTTLTNSTVSNNFATRNVGGLSTFGTTTLTNSTVSGNTAYNIFDSGRSAGGMLNFDSTLTLINSTVSGNTARGHGNSAGGIYSYSDGTLTLTNSTVSGNESRYHVGGVRHDGKLILSRSLISGNTGPDAAEILHDFGTVTANKFNLFGHSGDSGVVGFIPGANDLVPVEALNAIVAALSNNGGPTKTHALPSGSPALDAVETGCPPPAKDQRGERRPRDGDGDGTALCDTGAFERTVAASSCGGGPTSGCTVNGVANRLCLGTAGADVILGNNSNNVIEGLGGNDSVRGGQGDDVICGGDGRDSLFGEKGSDRLLGSRDNDVLRGGEKDDQLFGGAGNDALDGGTGPDTCNGGNGSGDSAVSCETVLNVP